ncbi:c-type cytochrome [Ideonella livida]|uniref:C-type cytochrome n=1 Tax=Ideonella livida TaxID=2707176 RepID=A0A7C9TNQ2_9BURK|nr:c-type cytochrome [Ideonella livida]NDY93487.1 c-type cytochrome [Ideonella livida]
MSSLSRIALLALATAAAPALAAGAADEAMVKLANTSGCFTCHHIEPGAKGPDGLAPIGPAWKDVAAKYAGQKGAAKTLTATVLAGSNPYESHWKGKVSGLAMPPNKVAITEADAGKLVNWILSLK